MISRASVNYLRISPRKVRYVIDLIRAKSVSAAWSILSGSPRRAGGIVEKLLNQAVDAAERNSHAVAGNLFISKVTADGGPTMKRFRAATMGRASTIRKRTSHICLELDLLKKDLANLAPKTTKQKTADKAPFKTKQPAGKSAAKKLAGAR